MRARIHSPDDFLLLLKGVKQGKDDQCTALCPGVNEYNIKHSPIIFMVAAASEVVAR
ncbi:hypothetical protein ACFLX4_00510 [Chloroflexota bacterium]